MHIVPDKEQGLRLDMFLAARFDNLSRARIKNLIEKGLAEVEGARVKPGQRLKAGQKVSLTVPPPEPTELIPEKIDFGIIYQDSDIVVINKPAGLVVHPAAGHRTGTLVNGLLEACPDIVGVGGEARPGIVHRLDKDTSGVMVAAKTETAHRNLVDSFKAGAVRKTYLAICRGRPRADRGEIKTSIGRHPVRRKEMSVRSPHGRPAETHWEVLERFRMGASWLKVRILTGRTHQIRVHLASIGHPILGDSVYGVTMNAMRVDKAGGGDPVTRQMLHAWRLGLIHPGTGREMKFEAPIPADMDGVLVVFRGRES